MAAFDITSLPGLTGTPEGARIFEQLQGILGGFESPFLTELQDLITGAPVQRTAGEESIIQDLVNIAGGASAARGLGAPTAGGIAQTVAPELTRQRQLRTSNLLQALGVQSAMRGQDISGLLNLGGLVMPTPVVTPRKQTGIGGILSGLGGLAGGIGSLGQAGGLSALLGGGGGAAAGTVGSLEAANLLPAFAGLCWVAEELYGPYSEMTLLARLYANNHDTPFIRLYAKHGKKWAEWLSRNEWAKPIVRPIWDNMAAKGAQMLGMEA